MATKINRTREEGTNNFGSKMVIVDYNGCMNIDVYFPEYDWIAKGVTYDHFKNGKISCPYERNVYGVGYLGEGEYKARENGKNTRIYNVWHNMMQRCYDRKYHEKHPTYINCTVSEEFHNFQNFGMWDKDNFYQIEGQQMCLDKDILFKHNKIYSPETCIYVPQTINKLFIKNDNIRGDSLIGTTLYNDKYIVQCRLLNPGTGKSKLKYLGLYDTQEKGFEVYKYYKEKNIKEVADYYKEHIPQKLHNAMYKYEVELTD